ncbi:TRAP transporter small permease [Serpentinicella alkaliphila]|uniref:TRAP-type C4-dicarboxylate transport system permease small subunit n=1 Tax=Serpentinicella alkaliphila TaxID=1734049 RepID=A0A4R2TX98_9FIRM|nr:TRAP transporter small permease [Serpentinicella alkaliphila]QUH25810.1 TRAP transporter small permease [Serpentinicella alkaliphila]TCP99822.1 TRAP-type C4-dicarboxylate transport system permease small subunit [Serpentinicella alkaliphila]
MIEKLSYIPKVLGIVNKWISYIVKGAISLNLLTMVGIVFYAVISRNFLNASIAWAEELSRILFIWLVFSGAVLGLYYRDHLGLTLLVERFKPKQQLVFEIISWILIIVVTRAMIYGGDRIVTTIKNARTPALGLPTTLKYWPVLLAGYAMVLISIESLFHSIIKLVKQFVDNNGRGE